MKMNRVCHLSARAGQLLTDIIVKGMKIERKDVYICNILKCRPPNNRNPLPRMR